MPIIPDPRPDTALVTEYRTNGTVLRYTLTRDALRLHMPELGARVVVIFLPAKAQQ